MKHSFLIIVTIFTVFVSACGKKNGTSKVDQHRAEKHAQDSTGLADQERTLAYFQAELDALLPVADSLLTLFKYEPKNEKYQDHGYYVAKGRTDLRILVRDDGGSVLIYRNGKRIETLPEKDKDYPLFERALQLQLIMTDIQEKEKQIQQTSFEIQKYQKRLQK